MDGIESSSIVETWRIRRIGGLSRKSNIVILLADGTHLCTCMESIAKGIICRHFWRVMLYSNMAKFHIGIIPIRWYKDCILTNLNLNLENSPILTAIKSATDVSIPSFQITTTFQTLQNFHNSNYNGIVHQNVPRRNRFGIAFSTAKTAINIALETNSDCELV